MPTSGKAVESRPRKGFRRPRRPSFRGAWVAIPYFLFLATFLVVPILANLWTAFFGSGGFSTTAFWSVLEEQYLSSFLLTTQLAVVTSLLGGLLGLVLAWALTTTRRPVWLRDLVTSFSALASQSGGVQLAFAFIAALGTEGLITVALERISPGVMDGFRITGFWGVTLVYLYFQVPLMAVLMLPSLRSLRRSWFEAAISLGATRSQYLRDIAMPILWPSIAASLLLLFANAFAAYATAYALAGGGLNLVPILIGFFIGGNVLMDESMAAALVVWMMIVILIAMGLRAALVRRSSRWLDQ